MIAVALQVLTNCSRNKIAESICRPAFDQAEKQTDMEEFSSWGNLLFKIRNKHGRKLEPRSRACLLRVISSPGPTMPCFQ